MRHGERETFARGTWLFARALGVVSLLAFGSFLAQYEGLIGERGVLPAVERLGRIEAVRAELSERGLSPDLRWPSLVHWTGASDAALAGLAWAGVAASLMLALGLFPAPAALVAWAIYLSLTGIGASFFLFQWDTLLLESLFLAAVVLPWRPLSRPSALRQPTRVGRWALWLLIGRLMFAAGIVKLASGDPAWRDLSALGYHAWTQPLPNPLSWPMAQLPNFILEFGTFMTFLIEIGLPFCIFFGRTYRHIACAGFASLQLAILLTGNFGFFNLLSLALCLPLLSDALFEALFEKRLPRIARRLRRAPAARSRLGGLAWGLRSSLAAALFLLSLSALVEGLGGALPGALLDAQRVALPFRVANRYGLFAIMTKSRGEILIEGSMDGRSWRPYRFRHKPEDPDEMPGISAPHMPRLDWQMWFAALGNARQHPWVARLMDRLLEGEPSVRALFANDPFPEEPPRYLRARVVDYRFTSIWDEEGTGGRYWRTEELGLYLPVRTRPPEPAGATRSRAERAAPRGRSRPR